MIDTILILGCGYTGAAVARLARSRGLRVVGTVRDPSRVAPLEAMDVEVLAAPAIDGARIAPLCVSSTHVVVTFPPDGTTDRALAPTAKDAGAITYVSSTAMYPDGEVSDETPIAQPPSDRASRLLAAEDAWRAQGATVLRCPAIYGSDRGIHLRIARGEHRIAGDGTTYTSRIHVDDLAQLLLASSKARGETFVVGDGAPATQNEIAEWVVREYGVAMPPHVPREDVPVTLRANRRVDGSRALTRLEVTLRYPSYADGMRKR